MSGIWQFATDTANAGVPQRWYLTDLKETVNLPGTTDLNKKGILNTDSSTMHLSRTQVV
ncbi:MAG: beta-galactosidase/beta-glucuronidase [Bacteroidetes bacterium]|nr:beta-galactosidase/beta-glucuronidase [Bacteroidota bacterium]